MPEKFIIPKEPKLDWKMLLPSLRRLEPFVSLSGKPVQHLFWARNAIYHGVCALGLTAGENILVPAFHCTSVVEPILRYGAEVKFYDVNLDLSVDFDDLRSKIDGKTRAILAIHYFGFPQPMQKLRELCQEHNLYLIEDCAHVLIGRTRDRLRLGHSGDISIFSWRKFLPIYDGGQLVINNPEIKLNITLDQGSFLFRLKVAKNTFERLLEESRGGWVMYLSAPWRLTALLLKHLVGSYSKMAKALRVNNYESEFNLDCVNLEMSVISKRILGRTDVAEVAERRRRNYTRLANAMRSMPGLKPLCSNLPDNICPWVFPFLVQGIKDFQLFLRAKGIPATSWGGVIHPTLPLEQFPKARFLYEHLVFLPIHQSLRDGDLDTIIHAVRQILNETVALDEKSLDDCIPLSAVSRR